MKNLKMLSRKTHMVLGMIFVLPLLYSATTGCLVVICKEILHNDALAETIIKFHTLEIIGLGKVYPFVVLAGVLGLVTTAIILLQKPKKKETPNS